MRGSINNNVQLLLIGLSEFSIGDWEQATVYRNYEASSRQIVWFWEVCKASIIQPQEHISVFHLCIPSAYLRHSINLFLSLYLSISLLSSTHFFLFGFLCSLLLLSLCHAANPCSLTPFRYYEHGTTRSARVCRSL